MELKDLKPLVDIWKLKKDRYENREVLLSDEFKDICKERVNQLPSAKQIEFLEYTTVVTTENKGKSNKVYFPNQWFILANICPHEYYEQIEVYKNIALAIANKIIQNGKYSGSSTKNADKLTDIFTQIRDGYKDAEDKDLYIQDFSNGYVDEIDESLDEFGIENKIKASEYIKQYVCNYEYWLGSKTIERTDSVKAPIINMLEIQNESSGFIGNLAMFLLRNEDLSKILEDTSVYKLKKIKSKLNFMHNRIIFGAPGTGKSFKLNLEIDKFDEYERVTFYSKYNYNNFVGSYKPVTKAIGNEERVTYDYVPGPFIRGFIKAVKNPDKNYLLIIEEINRANPAAVFGDLFQLLDRDKDGMSTYPINISEELKGFFRKEDSLGVNIEEITLPGNLFIWATMNSADQGIYPMDSAFKRRWSFEYIGVDDNQDKLISKPYNRIKLKSGPNDGDYEEYSWNEIRREINKILLKENVLEDKLIGPFFLDEKELTLQQKQFDELFKGKVLMYLFEDVLKHKNSSLFTVKKKSFSEIAKSYKDGAFFTFNLDDCKNDRV